RRIPYWGYHLDENRLGTDLIEVETDLVDMRDWGIFGYYVGEMVGERVPVISGIKHVPDHNMLKHFGAAASSSGGVELYHIPGITAEANTVEEAFGHRKPKNSFRFGPEEMKQAYEWLNYSAKDPH